jgi:hypothetical protein
MYILNRFVIRMAKLEDFSHPPEIMWWFFLMKMIMCTIWKIYFRGRLAMKAKYETAENLWLSVICLKRYAGSKGRNVKHNLDF